MANSVGAPAIDATQKAPVAATMGVKLCPSCHQDARKSEETEWLFLYTCVACGWKFATSRTVRK